MIQNVKLGAKPSPEDKRDYPIGRLVPVLNVFPEEFCLKHPKIKNQRSVGACVGESLSYTRDIKETEQNKRTFEFSPGFIYGLREDGQYQGEGMYPREALKNLLKYGAVLQKDFPDLEEVPGIIEKVKSRANELFDLAEPYKINAYARIYTPDQIKTAIIHKDLGPVSILCPVYDSFWNISKENPIVPIPNESSEKLHDYHQMTIIGWRNDSTWIVLNSWGEDWGDNGLCFMPFDFPIIEAWSITDTILPHPEPDPIKRQYYRVQLGAFNVEENASKLNDELNGKGFEAYVIQYDGYYRVQCGAFVREEDANKLMKKLAKAGYSGIIKYY